MSYSKDQRLQPATAIVVNDEWSEFAVDCANCPTGKVSIFDCQPYEFKQTYEIRPLCNACSQVRMVKPQPPRREIPGCEGWDL